MPARSTTSLAPAVGTPYPEIHGVVEDSVLLADVDFQRDVAGPILYYLYLELALP